MFRAAWHVNGVAMKLCDLSKRDYEQEWLNELETYHFLKDLQGNCILKLTSAAYEWGEMFFVIVTKIVGSPVKVDELSDQEHQEIVNTTVIESQMRVSP
jgi:hypothetical protein